MSAPRRPAAPDPQSPLWLCDALWKLGAVQFGDFTLGRTVRHSPVYLNPKLLRSEERRVGKECRL